MAQVQKGWLAAEGAPIDHAGAALRKIFDSGKYECLPGVVIFDAHDEYDQKGNLIRRIDKAKLESIAKKGNDRAEKTGDLAPIGLGHTKPLPATEIEQPPIIGFACNYRTVEMSGKDFLAVDYWIKKDQFHQLDQYPRRSVELWARRGDIDWIALLKRTPERDLGLVLPDVNETSAVPLYLEAGAKRASAYERQGDHKICYSLERFQMADPTAMPSADDAAGADADYMRTKGHCDRYMAETYPHMGDMHKRYAAEMMKAAPGGEAGAPATHPGGPEKTDPIGKPGAKPTDAPHGSLKPEGNPMPDQFAKQNDELLRYAAKIDALEKAQKDSLERYQHERCERMVDGLQAAGFLCDADPAVETRLREKTITRLMPLDEKGRGEEIQDIMRYAKQDPARVTRNFVPTQDHDYGEGRRPPKKADPNNPSEDQLDVALQYHRKTGKDMDECLQYAMTGKNGAA